MRLNELLSKLDSDINHHKRSILQLEDKKKKLTSLQDKIPNAIYHNGAVCLKDIWDKISCMKIERKQQFSAGRTDIVVKFSIGQKYRIDGRKIYSYPFDNTAASIFWNLGANPKIKNSIYIENIDQLIDDSCSKKKAFISRIKLFLIDEIHRYNLSIDDSQYNHEISKLLMLR